MRDHFIPLHKHEIGSTESDSAFFESNSEWIFGGVSFAEFHKVRLDVLWGLFGVLNPFPVGALQIPHVKPGRDCPARF